tara:strand:- start:1347 stop:1724 length:378 start_codon:yes stop_codon:yes gene_type:complete
MSRTIPSRFGYRGIVLPEDVYDGDSATADIDLGLGVWLRRQKLRLLGVDTPELRGAEKAAGRAARDFVRNLLPEDGEVLLRTHKGRKQGKYGRWLIELWIEKSPQQLVCVNDELLRAGHAVRYLD